MKRNARKWEHSESDKGRYSDYPCELTMNQELEQSNRYRIQRPLSITCREQSVFTARLMGRNLRKLY